MVEALTYEEQKSMRAPREPSNGASRRPYPHRWEQDDKQEARPYSEAQTGLLCCAVHLRTELLRSLKDK
jgi:hypothetical protein